MFSNLMMEDLRGVVLFYTKSHMRLHVLSVSSKTLSLMAVQSSSAKTVREVVEVDIIKAIIREDTTIVGGTNSSSISNKIALDSCLDNQPRRDVNFMWAISLGKLDGVSSRITSVSVVTSTVLRLLRIVVDARGGLDLSDSILRMMPRTLSIR